jgi:hypothetical protein
MKDTRGTAINLTARLQALLIRLDQLQEDGRVQARQHVQMVAEEYLHKGEIGSRQLDVRDHVADGDLQTHLQRHIQGILQRLVVVQTKHAKVHVVAGQRVGERVEHQANALVLLEVDVSLHRHLQDARPVRAADRAGLAEEQDAVGARVVEADAHTLVRHKLLQTMSTATQ